MPRYAVMLVGRNFCIPIEGVDAPAIGFITWRFASGSDPDALLPVVLRDFKNEPRIQDVIRLSEQHGYESPRIVVEEVAKVPFWKGRWNPKPGLIYYDREDEGNEP
ncbi:MAG: hypothetical protein AB1705_27120 [Verrucomicrobiota bacterium]